MLAWLARILVVVFFTWMAWSIYQMRYVLVIRIEAGQPRVRKGQVNSAFLDRLAEACQEGGVSRGWIGGIPDGKRIVLRFSRDFTPRLRQRVRNEWHAVG